jgi:hypothetical protein
MKRQCNLCGLREDIASLISKHKTWCHVYDKEIDNKHQNCEYWKPDIPYIRANKVIIAGDIKRKLQHQGIVTENRKINEMKITSLSIDTIWKEIENDYDINKRSFGRKISFITDSFKRTIIFRDVAHAYLLANSGFSKPAVILAGSVIEELLRLFLKHNNINPVNNKFESYINACEQSGLIKTSIQRLSDSVRHFRNIVHLEKEKSKRHTISKATAKGAVSSIFTIVNDF